MSAESDSFENCRWIPADESRFGIEVFDCGAFCQSMASMSSDPNVAARFVGLRSSSGEEYRGKLPPKPVAIDCNLAYPFSDESQDGPLFKADVMEDKWDIYLYDDCLYFARSWTGQLNYVAAVRFEQDEARLRSVTVSSKCNPDPRFTIGTVDYLIKSHIYRQLLPHPQPLQFPRDPKSVTMFSFSQFGRWARFGTYEDTTQLCCGEMTILVLRCPRSVPRGFTWTHLR